MQGTCIKSILEAVTKKSPNIKPLPYFCYPSRSQGNNPYG